MRDPCVSCPRLPESDLPTVIAAIRRGLRERCPGARRAARILAALMPDAPEVRALCQMGELCSGHGHDIAAPQATA